MVQVIKAVFAVQVDDGPFALEFSMLCEKGLCHIVDALRSSGKSLEIVGACDLENFAQKLVRHVGEVSHLMKNLSD